MDENLVPCPVCGKPFNGGDTVLIPGPQVVYRFPCGCTMQFSIAPRPDDHASR